MKGSVLTAVVLLMVQAEGVFTVAPCEPDCTGAANGDQVGDPSDCHAYYYCNNGDPYGPFLCDNGYVFDPVIGCVADDCGSTCIPVARAPKCPLTCNSTLNSIADAFDCSTYYFCTSSEVSEPQTCPAGTPYFDGNTHACVNDESVCCGGYCVQYCDGTSVFAPDPVDCTKFYICDGEEGVPDEEHHFTCEEGYFDVQFGGCVYGIPPAPCPTLCDAVTLRKKSEAFSYRGQERA